MPIVTTQASPFSQTRFLGASIANFSCQLGWNEQTTSLTVSLVEDTSTATTKKVWTEYQIVSDSYQIKPLSVATTVTTADSFAPPNIGDPVHFRFEDFIFNGILQSWEKKNDFNGIYYEVTIHGPTEVLSAVQLIIGGYSGGIGAIRNLINCYGYYENNGVYAAGPPALGFGAAQVNEAGMPWYPSNGLGLKTAITNNINSLSSSTYNGKMYFRNQRYFIDLTTLPVVPNYYRIGGNNVNLLEVISQVCQDAGYDFFATLEFTDDQWNDNTNYPPVISFSIVSRKEIPDLTTLQTFVDARTDASNKSRGRELRNEETVAFLVGGQQERLYTQYLAMDVNPANNTIWPYWGVDAQGNAVIGNGINDGHTFTVDSRMVNCSGVGATYNLNVGEIRAALAGIDSWTSYIAITSGSKATQLGINGRLSVDPTLSGILAFGGGDALTLANTTVNFADMSKDDPKQENLLNLYTFVEGLAKEYYGKKFMVRLNNLPEPYQVVSEPDTSRTLMSYEPIDAGYLDNADWLLGNRPLDFPALYEDMFTTEDGKWLSFVRFNNASGLDMKEISPDDAIVYNYGATTTGVLAYVKTSIEPFFVYGNAAASSDPRAILTLPGSVNARVANSGEVWGPAQMILKAIIAVEGGDPINGTPTTQQKNKANSYLKTQGNNSSAYFPYDFGPEAQAPLAAIVPLRDNIRTYGPWYNVGVAASGGGKVRFEQNTELVPWNFNGYTFMNNAGNAQIINVSASQQEAEMGRVELVGAPVVQLGEALVSGGPNVTGMDISVGPNGVTTSYTLRTYTPTFGGFSKQQSDRYQRLTRVGRDNRREALKKMRSIDAVPQSYFNNRAGLYSNKGTKGSINSSPHTIIYSSYHHSPHWGSGEAAQSGYSIAFGTIEEGLASINKNNYKQQAISSLDTVFAPYSAWTGDAQMAHWQAPIWSGSYEWSGLIQGQMPKTSWHFDQFSIQRFGAAQTGIPGISLAAYSGSYPTAGLQSYHNKQHEENSMDIRCVGLKGPVIVTGWGYDLFGRPVPNTTGVNEFPFLNTGAPGGFPLQFLHQPYTWKSGPLNLRWNPLKGVWDGGSTLFRGTYMGEIGGTGAVDYNGITLPITDWLDVSLIESGTRLVCGFIDDAVTVISANC